MSHPTEVRDLYPSSPLGETEGDVPTGRDVEWEPLVDYRRNGVSETTIHGAILQFSEHGLGPLYVGWRIATGFVGGKRTRS